MMATVPPDPNPDSPPAQPTPRPDEVSPPPGDVDVPDQGPVDSPGMPGGTAGTTDVPRNQDDVTS